MNYELWTVQPKRSRTNLEHQPNSLSMQVSTPFASIYYVSCVIFRVAMCQISVMTRTITESHRESQNHTENHTESLRKSHSESHGESLRELHRQTGITRRITQRTTQTHRITQRITQRITHVCMCMCVRVRYPTLLCLVRIIKTKGAKTPSPISESKKLQKECRGYGQEFAPKYHDRKPHLTE